MIVVDIQIVVFAETVMVSFGILEALRWLAESRARECWASDNSVTRSCLSAMASKATIVGTMNRMMPRVRQMKVDKRPVPVGSRIVNAMDKFG